MVLTLPVRLPARAGCAQGRTAAPQPPPFASAFHGERLAARGGDVVALKGGKGAAAADRGSLEARSPFQPKAAAPLPNPARPGLASAGPRAHVTPAPARARSRRVAAFARSRAAGALIVRVVLSPRPPASHPASSSQVSANLKVLRDRIGSVKSTKKITGASRVWARLRPRGRPRARAGPAAAPAPAARGAARPAPRESPSGCSGAGGRPPRRVPLAGPGRPTSRSCCAPFPSAPSPPVSSPRRRAAQTR